MEGASLSPDGTTKQEGDPHTDGYSPRVTVRQTLTFPPPRVARELILGQRRNPTTQASQTFQEISLQLFQMNYNII